MNIRTRREIRERAMIGADGKQMYWVKTGIVDQLLLATDGGKQ